MRPNGECGEGAMLHCAARSRHSAGVSFDVLSCPVLYCCCTVLFALGNGGPLCVLESFTGVVLKFVFSAVLKFVLSAASRAYVSPSSCITHALAQHSWRAFTPAGESSAATAAAAPTATAARAGRTTSVTPAARAALCSVAASQTTQALPVTAPGAKAAPRMASEGE